MHGWETFFKNFLLWVQKCLFLLGEEFFLALKEDSLSNFGVWSWSNEFNLRFILIAGSDDHSITHESSNTSWLKVGGNDNESRHTFDFDELLKSRGYFSDFSVTHINFFAVEILTLWVFPALNNLSYSKIKLGELFQGGLFFLTLLWGILGCLFLSWSLLLLLFWLLLFFLFGGRLLFRGLFLLGLFLLLLLFWLLLSLLRLLWLLLFLLLLLFKGLGSQFWVSSLWLFSLLIRLSWNKEWFWDGERESGE